ncbi:hypothetical protein CDAR_103481 [Caerostris darwini]|uniref:Uncharacterized protein n=1 Tax=Caerostris darwini TaxID=1538125 RepID=A0AAV4PN86_9ARAC|nr:hypothetical protein CDAR_103481 [Caerostris darwini]
MQPLMFSSISSSTKKARKRMNVRSRSRFFSLQGLRLQRMEAVFLKQLLQKKQTLALLVPIPQALVVSFTLRQFCWIGLGICSDISYQNIAGIFRNGDV